MSAVTATGITRRFGQREVLRSMNQRPLPIALLAMTVNVYDVPFVSPVTTCVVPVVPALVSTPPGGLDITV